MNIARYRRWTDKIFCCWLYFSPPFSFFWGESRFAAVVAEAKYKPASEILVCITKISTQRVEHCKHFHKSKWPQGSLSFHSSFSNVHHCLCVFVWTGWVSRGHFTLHNLSWQAALSVHTFLSLGRVVIPAWMWWPSAVYTTLCASVMSQVSPLQTAGCVSSCAALFMTPPLLRCALIALFLYSEFVSFLCFLTVCCGSWLSEQVVQALLPDRHLQGLWREVWSASRPRWPGTPNAQQCWQHLFDFVFCFLFKILGPRAHTEGREVSGQ